MPTLILSEAPMKNSSLLVATIGFVAIIVLTVLLFALIIDSNPGAASHEVLAAQCFASQAPQPSYWVGIYPINDKMEVEGTAVFFCVADRVQTFTLSENAGRSKAIICPSTGQIKVWFEEIDSSTTIGSCFGLIYGESTRSFTVEFLP